MVGGQCEESAGASGWRMSGSLPKYQLIFIVPATFRSPNREHCFDGIHLRHFFGNCLAQISGRAALATKPLGGFLYIFEKSIVSTMFRDPEGFWPEMLKWDELRKLRDYSSVKIVQHDNHSVVGAIDSEIRT